MVSTQNATTYPSQSRAREIMGDNIFGVEEAMRHFGVRPTEEDLAALAQVPYSEATLQKCKDSHILAAVFPLSIAEIAEFAKGALTFAICHPDDPKVIEGRGTLTWLLLAMDPVGFDESLENQLRLLGKDDGPVAVRDLLYAMVGWFLHTGRRLFVDEFPDIDYYRCHYVRSSTRHAQLVYRYIVGFLDSAPTCVHVVPLANQTIDNVAIAFAKQGH